MFLQAKQSVIPENEDDNSDKEYDDFELKVKAALKHLSKSSSEEE